jgi:hypothetical protein
VSTLTPHLRVLLLKGQRVAALSFRENRIKNTLLLCLKEWFAVVILEKDSDEKLSLQLIISQKKRKKREILHFWLNSLQVKTESSARYFQTRILRCHFQEWRMLNRVRLMNVRLGAVCGVLRVYRKRAFQSWVSVWKKRKATGYAVHLLQLTFDRATARRALHNWPGWRQYRKSEEFRMKLFQKKRESSVCMLQVIEMLGKEDEEGRIEGRGKGLRTDKHLKIKDPLSLAERVAFEASSLIIRESQGSRQGADQMATWSACYAAAVTAAKCALLSRAGMLTSEISGDLNASSGVVRTLDFFLGSLRFSQSGEEQAVQELLLLLQIVMMAWSKAAKMLSSWRVKGRRLRRSANKVIYGRSSLAYVHVSQYSSLAVQVHSSDV